MAHTKLSKKGQHRVTPTASKPTVNQDITREEFELRMESFAENLHEAIEEARGKMSPERRAESDRKANAALEKSASSDARRSQRGA